MIENSMYESCTRNCPFTSFQWYETSSTFLNADAVAAPYFVGSDLPPLLTGVGTINSFSIQLRLGNELLPQ
jgi:hypothetical protein